MSTRKFALFHIALALETHIVVSLFFLFLGAEPTEGLYTHSRST